jgi:SAM-dependent methyltransferase
MSAPQEYRPREFWQRTLAAYPDLRGTGEPGLSLAYNEAMYDLRRRVLERELHREGARLQGARVLDLGSGVGFYVDLYLRRGAQVTGVELTDAGAALLRARFPAAHILHGDIAEVDAGGDYDIVNVWDVLYHITDEARFEAALGRAARALRPGGVLLLTDVFRAYRGRLAAHNVMREEARYRAVLEREGVEIARLVPTHFLLNRPLGLFRSLNRVPALLHAIDRALLATGARVPEPCNRLLVARRRAAP